MQTRLKTGSILRQQHAHPSSKPLGSSAAAAAASSSSAAAHLDEDDPNEALRGASGKGYLWEEAYKRSWDVLEEDEDGTLTSVIERITAQKRRRIQSRDTRPLHRGIIRHLYLVIDMSSSMADASTADHLRSGKLEATITAAEGFVNEFFEVNPLGSLGIIVTRDGGAEKLTEMSGNTSEHIEALKKRENREPRGDPSIQNSLELARRSLMHIPAHGSRDILIIYGSLTTCDPGNIFDTISQLKSDNIRVSIVGLSAEMRICKKVAEDTGGIYSIVLNEANFREIMGQHVPPPALATEKVGTSLIEMGFPVTSHFEPPTLCASHRKPTHIGYICPRCGVAVCELPVDCPVCSLTLVSSTLLARSYHHLFPGPNFSEVPVSA
ncbi:hypothetical protein HDU76_006640, partial [Blyttiomyces sp. JEL0837]